MQPPAASTTPATAQTSGTSSRLSLVPLAECAQHKREHLQQNQQLQVQRARVLPRGPAVLVHVPLKRLRLHALSSAAATADPSIPERQDEEGQHTAGQPDLPPLPLLRLYPMGLVAGSCGSGKSRSPAAVPPAGVGDADGRYAAGSSGLDAAVQGGGPPLPVPAGSSGSSSTRKRARLEEWEQEVEQQLLCASDGGGPDLQQVVTARPLGASGDGGWCCHGPCCWWTEDGEGSSCWDCSSSSGDGSGGSVGA